MLKRKIIFLAILYSVQFLYAKTSFALTPAEIFSARSDAVVTIYCENEDGTESNGSGFFIDSKGMLVTNYHVIEYAEKIMIGLQNNEIVSAINIVAQSPEIDLALIQTALNSNKALKIADKLPSVGANVCVIGAPLGLSHSLTDGILSAVRGSKKEYIQISAPISPGSSGSPVFDSNGNVIGVASFFLKDGQNMNFAPSAIALRNFIHQKPMIAKTTGKTQQEQSLKKEKANVALYNGLRNGLLSKEETQRLLKAGADVDAKFAGNITPLWVAVANTFDANVIKVLIDAGADVNHAESTVRTTVLMNAASRASDPNVIRMLINAGAYINQKNKFGETALTYATRDTVNPDIIQVLLNAGANANAKNMWGQTALQIAEEHNPNPEVKKILKNAANIVN
jgi:hypothetical protein